MVSCLDIESTKSPEHWSNYESRIREYGHHKFLDETNLQATFLLWGGLQKYPEVVKRINNQGFESSHTHYHQLMYDQSRHQG